MCIIYYNKSVMVPTSIIPVLGRLRQKNYHKFKANVGYKMSSRPHWALGYRVRS